MELRKHEGEPEGAALPRKDVEGAGGWDDIRFLFLKGGVKYTGALPPLRPAAPSGGPLPYPVH